MTKNISFSLCFCAVLLSATMSRAQVVNNTPTPSAITATEQQFEIGPTLDVVPYVLADGYTINLTLIPELLQFDQYDTPPNIPQTTVANVVQLPVALPHFTVREVVTTVNIWDNQTVVLGGLVSSTISTENDKVPFLGDLPLFGRLFQSQSKSSVKKNLMVFVTATIIDPAGNRIHTDDQLPFNPATIPAQPSVEGQTFQPAPAMTSTPPPASTP
ncbi:MAG TPA: hypothetical protein VGI03_12650 [Verrucomicrobiae bacterium]|jgi:general secretion pathway protein D